jgi:hypothetical protein
MGWESVLLSVLGVVALVCMVGALVEQSKPDPSKRLLPPEELERIEIEAGLIPGFEGAVALETYNGRRVYRLPDGRVVPPPSERKRELEAYDRVMREKWGEGGEA